MEVSEGKTTDKKNELGTESERKNDSSSCTSPKKIVQLGVVSSQEGGKTASASSSKKSRWDQAPELEEVIQSKTQEEPEDDPNFPGVKSLIQKFEETSNSTGDATNQIDSGSSSNQKPTRVKLVRTNFMSSSKEKSIVNVEKQSVQSSSSEVEVRPDEKETDQEPETKHGSSFDSSEVKQVTSSKALQIISSCYDSPTDESSQEGESVSTSAITSLSKNPSESSSLEKTAETDDYIELNLTKNVIAHQDDTLDSTKTKKENELVLPSGSKVEDSKICQDELDIRQDNAPEKLDNLKINMDSIIILETDKSVNVGSQGEKSNYSSSRELSLDNKEKQEENNVLQRSGSTGRVDKKATEVENSQPIDPESKIILQKGEYDGTSSTNVTKKSSEDVHHDENTNLVQEDLTQAVQISDIDEKTTERENSQPIDPESKTILQKGEHDGTSSTNVTKKSSEDVHHDKNTNLVQEDLTQAVQISDTDEKTTERENSQPIDPESKIILQTSEHVGTTPTNVTKENSEDVHHDEDTNLVQTDLTQVVQTSDTDEKTTEGENAQPIDPESKVILQTGEHVGTTPTNTAKENREDVHRDEVTNLLAGDLRQAVQTSDTDNKPDEDWVVITKKDLEGYTDIKTNVEKGTLPDLSTDTSRNTSCSDLNPCKIDGVEAELDSVESIEDKSEKSCKVVEGEVPIMEEPCTLKCDSPTYPEDDLNSTSLSNVPLESLASLPSQEIDECNEESVKQIDRDGNTEEGTLQSGLKSKIETLNSGSSHKLDIPANIEFLEDKLAKSEPDKGQLYEDEIDATMEEMFFEGDALKTPLDRAVSEDIVSIPDEPSTEKNIEKSSTLPEVSEHKEIDFLEVKSSQGLLDILETAGSAMTTDKNAYLSTLNIEETTSRTDSSQENVDETNLHQSKEVLNTHAEFKVSQVSEPVEHENITEETLNIPKDAVIDTNLYAEDNTVTDNISTENPLPEVNVSAEESAKLEDKDSKSCCVQSSVVSSEDLRSVKELEEGRTFNSEDGNKSEEISSNTSRKDVDDPKNISEEETSRKSQEKESDLNLCQQKGEVNFEVKIHKEENKDLAEVSEKYNESKTLIPSRTADDLESSESKQFPVKKDEQKEEKEIFEPEDVNTDPKHSKSKNTTESLPSTSSEKETSQKNIGNIIKDPVKEQIVTFGDNCKGEPSKSGSLSTGLVSNKEKIVSAFIDDAVTAETIQTIEAADTIETIEAIDSFLKESGEEQKDCSDHLKVLLEENDVTAQKIVQTKEEQKKLEELKVKNENLFKNNKEFVTEGLPLNYVEPVDINFKKSEIEKSSLSTIQSVENNQIIQKNSSIESTSTEAENSPELKFKLDTKELNLDSTNAVCTQSKITSEASVTTKSAVESQEILQQYEKVVSIGKKENLESQINLSIIESPQGTNISSSNEPSQSKTIEKDSTKDLAVNSNIAIKRTISGTDTDFQETNKKPKVFHESISNDKPLVVQSTDNDVVETKITSESSSSIEFLTDNRTTQNKNLPDEISSQAKDEEQSRIRTKLQENIAEKNVSTLDVTTSSKVELKHHEKPFVNDVQPETESLLKPVIPEVQVEHLESPVETLQETRSIQNTEKSSQAILISDKTEVPVLIVEKNLELEEMKLEPKPKDTLTSPTEVKNQPKPLEKTSSIQVTKMLLIGEVGSEEDTLVKETEIKPKAETGISSSSTNVPSNFKSLTETKSSEKSITSETKYEDSPMSTIQCEHQSKSSEVVLGAEKKFFTRESDMKAEDMPKSTVQCSEAVILDSQEPITVTHHLTPEKSSSENKPVRKSKVLIKRPLQTSNKNDLSTPTTEAKPVKTEQQDKPTSQIESPCVVQTVSVESTAETEPAKELSTNEDKLEIKTKVTLSSMVESSGKSEEEHIKTPTEPKPIEKSINDQKPGNKTKIVIKRPTEISNVDKLSESSAEIKPKTVVKEEMELDPKLKDKLTSPTEVENLPKPLEKTSSIETTKKLLTGEVGSEAKRKDGISSEVESSDTGELPPEIKSTILTEPPQESASKQPETEGIKEQTVQNLPKHVAPESTVKTKPVKEAPPVTPVRVSARQKQRQAAAAAALEKAQQEKSVPESAPKKGPGIDKVGDKGAKKSLSPMKEIHIKIPGGKSVETKQSPIIAQKSPKTTISPIVHGKLEPITLKLSKEENPVIVRSSSLSPKKVLSPQSPQTKTLGYTLKIGKDSTTIIPKDPSLSPKVRDSSPGSSGSKSDTFGKVEYLIRDTGLTITPVTAAESQEQKLSKITLKLSKAGGHPEIKQEKNESWKAIQKLGEIDITPVEAKPSVESSKRKDKVDQPNSEKKQKLSHITVEPSTSSGPSKLQGLLTQAPLNQADISVSGSFAGIGQLSQKEQTGEPQYEIGLLKPEEAPVTRKRGRPRKISSPDQMSAPISHSLTAKNILAASLQHQTLQQQLQIQQLQQQQSMAAMIQPEEDDGSIPMFQCPLFDLSDPMDSFIEPHPTIFPDQVQPVQEPILRSARGRPIGRSRRSRGAGIPRGIERGGPRGRPRGSRGIKRMLEEMESLSYPDMEQPITLDNIDAEIPRIMEPVMATETTIALLRKSIEIKKENKARKPEETESLHSDLEAKVREMKEKIEAAYKAELKSPGKTSPEKEAKKKRIEEKTPEKIEVKKGPPELIPLQKKDDKINISPSKSSDSPRKPLDSPRKSLESSRKLSDSPRRSSESRKSGDASGKSLDTARKSSESPKKVPDTPSRSLDVGKPKRSSTDEKVADSTLKVENQAPKRKMSQDTASQEKAKRKSTEEKAETILLEGEESQESKPNEGLEEMEVEQGSSQDSTEVEEVKTEPEPPPKPVKPRPKSKAEMKRIKREKDRLRREAKKLAALEALKAPPPNPNEEDTRMSASDPNGDGTDGVKKSRGMEVGDPEGKEFTVADIAEYQWPLQGGELYMIQEQISTYLGVKSFKRKYPDLRRRPVEMEERTYLCDSGLVAESMCDLGLTAVSSSEVLDVLFQDFPDKYEELRKVMREKAAQELINKQKERKKFEQSLSKSDLKEHALQSAMSWNQSLNRSRTETRKCHLDLQTWTIQYPRSRGAKMTKPTPKLGNYPVAVIPGQYTDYYKRYTAQELRYWPVNTVLYGPLQPNERNSTVGGSEGSQSESEDSSSSDDSSDSSSDGEGTEEEKDKVGGECRACASRKDNKVPCTQCGRNSSIATVWA